MIGPGGGTLISSDGRLTVSIPAGALPADTEVGIQPITATAPGALGSAYRLTPDGQRFAQPVTLTFRYSAEEAGASAPGALRVATHDSQGRWGLPTMTTTDASARALSVATSHFSDWSYLSGEQLRPASAYVLVNTHQPLQYIECGDDGVIGGDNENPQRLLLECREVHNEFAARWAVNGISGGNASIGTIDPSNPSKNWFGDYRAPASVPSPNPVAASVTFGSQAQFSLVSQLTIGKDIPAYQGTFSSRFNAVAAGAQSQMLGNIRFELDSVDAVTGAMTYRGSGSAQLGGRFTAADGRACEWDRATGDINPGGSSLVVFPDGNGDLSKRYQITVYAQAMSTLRCEGSEPSPGPLIVAHSVSVDQQCALPTYEQLWQFAGSWNCTVAGSGTTSANWTLHASR